MKPLMIVLIWILNFGQAFAETHPTGASRSSLKSNDPTSIALVTQYYQRVTGLSLRQSEAQQLVQQIRAQDGSVDQTLLFERLFAEQGFVDNRLATFVSRMSNEQNEPFEDVDDYQVALLLAVTTNMDLRQIFTKSFFIERIKAPNKPVNSARESAFTLGVALNSASEIPSDFRLNFTPMTGEGVYSDGLFSTNGFGSRFLAAGTNRKAIRGIFDIILCKKIESWMDSSLDHTYIGRDVDPSPGGDPTLFAEKCSSCHAPMDGMRQAFAYYNYQGDREGIKKMDKVQPKYSQNIQPKSAGYETLDDQWEILLTTPTHQERFGWRGPTTGKGVTSYASAIVNSKQFQTCMTQKLVGAFCNRSDDQVRALLKTPEFERLTDSFRDDGYKVRTLIQKIVTSEVCK